MWTVLWGETWNYVRCVEGAAVEGRMWLGFPFSSFLGNRNDLPTSWQYMYVSWFCVCLTHWTHFLTKPCRRVERNSGFENGHPLSLFSCSDSRVAAARTSPESCLVRTVQVFLLTNCKECSAWSEKKTTQVTIATNVLPVGQLHFECVGNVHRNKKDGNITTVCQTTVCQLWALLSCDLYWSCIEVVLNCIGSCDSMSLARLQRQCGAAHMRATDSPWCAF